MFRDIRKPQLIHKAIWLLEVIEESLFYPSHCMAYIKRLLYIHVSTLHTHYVFVYTHSCTYVHTYVPVLAIYMALCTVSATGHVEEITPSLLMVCNLVPVIGSIASHTSDFLPRYTSNEKVWRACFHKNIYQQSSPHRKFQHYFPYTSAVSEQHSLLIHISDTCTVCVGNFFSKTSTIGPSWKCLMFIKPFSVKHE